MVLTSHYMEDIERLCERIVIMREGEVVYDGALAQVVGKYARHKTVHVRLKGELASPVKVGSDLSTLLPGLGAGVGEIFEVDESGLKVRVQRPKATDISAALLQHLPVLDLTIEEEDIATIIESIMRGGLA
jgi:ABC-2 type transport system ATP-binding protein